MSKKDNEVLDGVSIENVEVTYTQEQDTCGITPDPANLKIRMVRMDDDPDGFYFVMETTGFAFNDKEEVTKIVDDFIKRCKP